MLKSLPPAKLAVLALITANVIWGAAPPIYKWALGDLQPFALSFFRFFLGAVILLPFTVHRLHIARNDWVKLLGIALLGTTIHIGLFTFGLKFTSSINVPIIASAGPVFLIMGSVFFLHEQLKRKVIIGTCLSFLGVVVIILRPVFESGLDSSVVGNLFFVISTLANVLYTMLLKKFTVKYDPLVITFWSFLIGAITFLPMFYLEVLSAGGPVWNVKSIFSALYASIFASAIGYYLYNKALKHLVTNEVGIFVYLDPIITAVVAFLLLHETVTSSYLLGAALVFIGIFIAEGRLHWHPLHHLRR